MRVHFLDRRGARSDKPPVDIDGTAAHSLHQPSVRIGKGAFAARDDIGHRFSVSHDAEDRYLKAPDFTGSVGDRKQFPGHPRFQFLQRHDLVHRPRFGREAPQRRPRRHRRQHISDSLKHFTQSVHPIPS